MKKLKTTLVSVFLCLLSLCILLMNASCSTHPINEHPVSYPKTTRSGVSYINNETDLKRIAWWKKLNDPELNQLLTEALASNNQIKSSYATIKEAQAQLKSAQYAWIPTLDATANGATGRPWDSNVTPAPSLANNSFFNNLPHAKFRGYYAGFIPQYSFNILNNIYNVKNAKAALALQQARGESTKLGIISQMSGAYFMLISQREQLEVEKTLRDDLKKLHQLERLLFQGGATDVATQIDIDQQVAQEDANIPQIESVIAQSENTIRLLLAQNPASFYTQRSLLSLNVDHLIPNFLPSSVLKNRPDIMIALNELKIASAQIGNAYAAFFPTITLTGLVGNVSVDLTNILKLSANLWATEITGATKILNMSSYQNIKAAKSGFDVAYYNYIETLRAAFADVDDNLTIAVKNKSSYLQTQERYQAAKKAYEIAFIQYKSGSADYRHVMNSKINLDRVQLNLIQAKAQFLDSIVQVYNAVAGGYDVQPSSD